MRRYVILISLIAMLLLLTAQIPSYAQAETRLDFSDIAWSPDGQSIAATGDAGLEVGGDIWLIRVDGSNQQNLTADSPLDGQPHWSPDGSKIAFTSSRAYPTMVGLVPSDIWLMNADGSNPSQLMEDFEFTTVPSGFSPNGEFVLAVVTELNMEEQIFRSFIGLIAADGSTYTQISPDDDSVYTSPKFSGDGQQIGFLSISQTFDLHTLWTVGIKDGVVEPPNSALQVRDTWLVNFSWSSDGQAIVYTSFPIDTAHASISILNIPNRQVTKLLEDFPHQVTYPEWSPDGSKIAFLGYDIDKPHHIWVMSPDGSEPTNLSGDLQGDHSGIVWSPDSTKIAFIVRNYDTDETFLGADIWVMNADGTNPINLTANVP